MNVMFRLLTAEIVGALEVCEIAYVVGRTLRMRCVDFVRLIPLTVF